MMNTAQGSGSAALQESSDAAWCSAAAKSPRSSAMSIASRRNQK
jgi:hypothetical protein